MCSFSIKCGSVFSHADSKMMVYRYAGELLTFYALHSMDFLNTKCKALIATTVIVFCQYGPN
jgi:hypothetical protein